MRAAIYVRISRDRVGAGLGVARQEQECRELIGRMGWKVAGVYSDNDLTAYSGKPRPSYRRLLADVQAGAVDVIVAWHTDRLHRAPWELEEYITACETHGVPTHTVKAGLLDLSTPSGRLVARQLGAVARYEVEHAIERQLLAKKDFAMAGVWGGGRRPYGYAADGVTVLPEEAAVVSAASACVLAGASLRSVCLDLNKRGVKTSTGKAWRATELKRVLIRPRNAGLRQHQGKVIGAAVWPALVPEEQWRAVTSLLSAPDRRTSPPPGRRWLLTGLVQTPCGGRCQVHRAGPSRRRTTSYTCVTDRCVVRVASEVDAMIEELVIWRLEQPDAIDLLRPAAPAVDLGKLRTESLTLRQRLDDLADDLDIDERTMARRSQKLRQRLEAVEQEMTQAGRGSALDGLVGVPDVPAVWAALDLDRKRAVIDVLMEIKLLPSRRGRPPGWRPGERYFDPRTVQVKWRKGE